jgi:hypothetical protein
MLHAEVERALRDAERLGRARGAGARQVGLARERLAVRLLEPAERAGRIDRCDLLAARRVRGPSVGDDEVDRHEPGDVAVDVDRPALLAGGDPCALLGGEPGQREADRREIGAGVTGIAELLEQERLLDEPELRFRDVEPAELREIRPAVVGGVPVAIERETVREPGAGLLLQLELVLAQREVH